MDAAPKILPEIPHRLGDYAAQELAGRGVEIHVGTTLESRDGRRGRRSATARRSRPARSSGRPASARTRCSASSALPLDDRGRVEVDELLRVRGHEHVWALGDCARVPNTRGRSYPTRRRASTRSARRGGSRRTSPATRSPYGYRMLGQVATLGRYKGIADVLGLRLRGFPGWWVTRTYHLYQLPLWSRKLRVVTDWTTSLLFRRDVVELGTLGHPEGLG